MAANLKSSKDKPPGSAQPRLAPRQTAASTARAARIATNRNLQNNGPPPSKAHQPLPRSPILRTKSATSYRSDSKTVDHKLPSPVQKPTGDIQAVLDDSPDGNNKYQQLKVQPASSEHEDMGLQSSEDGDTTSTLVSKEPVKSRSHTPVKSRPQTPKSRPLTPKSRPVTPARYSRPRTPNTVNGSRPNTPSTSDRPSTPAQPQRLGTPNENINKQENSNCSPTRNASKECVAEAAASDDDSVDLKQAFDVKHREFITLKRDLDMKQQTVLSMFDKLKKLHDRMKEEGIQVAGEGFRSELVVFNVGDWSADEIAKLCQDAIAAQSPNVEEVFKSVSAPIESTTVVELSTQIVAIPNNFANLCLEAFTTRQQLIDWIKNIWENDECNNQDVSQHLSEYNKQGFEMCNALKYLKDQADSVANRVAELSRRACRERDILFMVGESLIREVAKLKADTQDLNHKFEKRIQGRPIETKALEETLTELDSERLEGAAAKEKITNLESQLKQAKARINKMDRQLKEADASIASLTGTVKSLEDQSQRRELQLEAKARKLRENLKCGEMTSAQLAQQRNELELEIQRLNDHIESMKSKHKADLHQSFQQIKDLDTLLKVQRIETAKELNNKAELERAYNDSKNEVEELKVKLERAMRPKVDLPTEREMTLHAELQATIEVLRLTEEEVAAARKEKIRFLETMTKVTDSDNKVGMQQKFASELMNKEETIAQLQSEIKDLKKNIKLNEHKCSQYEENIREILSFNQSHGLVPDSQGGPSYQELQQEIMDLRMKLLEAAHRNEELNSLLIQKEQELDQQDKTSRAQARVIKVREELINMLKHREAEQNQELANMHQDLDHRVKIVEEVNRQIAAKSSEIQELFATLESKQQQIHRLEKIVLALEEQQRRAQAQRTRHEEKIAALEHELVSEGNRQNKKFLFF